MKTLFEFTLKQNNLLEDGTNKIIERNFVLIRPSSNLKDKAEIFHAKTISELVAQGVLTRQMLQKRLINDGGILSEQEKKDAIQLYQTFIDLQSEFQKLIIIPAETRTPEEKTRIEELTVELTTKGALIQEFELSQIVLFDNTAEVIARNRHIFWWILQLAHEKIKDKIIPIFGEGDFDYRRNQYDNLMEDDFANKTLFPILAELVTAWYVRGIDNKEMTEIVNKFTAINEKRS